MIVMKNTELQQYVVLSYIFSVVIKTWVPYTTHLNVTFEVLPGCYKMSLWSFFETGERQPLIKRKRSNDDHFAVLSKGK